MTAMTPQEVMKALAAEWRRVGLTYHDIARETGYKYQTIANFIANKKTYFTSAQAVKFKPLGYNLNFLMFGEGTLLPGDDPARLMMQKKNFLPEGYKVYLLLTAIRTLGIITDDPLVQKVYRTFFQAFTTGDKTECLNLVYDIQEELSRSLFQKDDGIDEK